MPFNSTDCLCIFVLCTLREYQEFNLCTGTCYFDSVPSLRAIMWSTESSIQSLDSLQYCLEGFFVLFCFYFTSLNKTLSIRNTIFTSTSILPLDVGASHSWFSVMYFLWHIYHLQTPTFQARVPSSVCKTCISEDTRVVIELWIAASPGLKSAIYMAFLVLAS